MRSQIQKLEVIFICIVELQLILNCSGMRSFTEFQANRYFSSHYENSISISLEKDARDVNLSSYTKNAGKEENLAPLNTKLTNIMKRCPAPNKRSKGHCKKMARKFTPYCSNHNRCRACEVEVQENWPLCKKCDPEGINGEHSRPLPRPQKCHACDAGHECVACKNN